MSLRLSGDLKLRGDRVIIAPTANLPDDADAWAYIQAVEAADGQALEAGVRTAINTFVKGCKADGIWDAIKASCILAGARTLNGALVPLKGAAPTNFNFVAGDYNRKTGLKGNGSTKYLDGNRNNNADPQNNEHLSVWRSSAPSNNGILLGSGNVIGHSHLYEGEGFLYTRSNSTSFGGIALPVPPGLYALSRSTSSGFVHRAGAANYSVVDTSSTPVNAPLRVFGPAVGYTNARLAFYSIGESLDLALLDARVTTLINTLASVIP